MIPEPEAPRAARFLPELALVAVTLFWGVTFLLVQRGLAHAGPFFLVATRFAAAALALMLVTGRHMRGLTALEVRSGLIIGTGMVGCYLFQTIGLLSIPSSMSAFITAAYVPLVPIIELAIYRRMPSPIVWAGVALAFLGLLLLAGPEAVLGFRLGFGEAITLSSALVTAVQIVQIGSYAGRVDVRRVSVLQLGTVALLCFAAMPFAGESLPGFSWPLAGVVLALGIGSAFVQISMNWAQRSVAATRATLIYAGEPVYAGIVGRIAGERLPAVALLGGFLVVASVIVSEWRPRRRRPG